MKPPSELGGAAHVRGFMEAAGTSAEAFTDEEKTLFTAIGQVKPLPLWTLFLPSSLRSLVRAKQKGATFDHGGEGLLAGGGLVLDAAGTVVYAWQEGLFGDHANA